MRRSFHKMVEEFRALKRGNDFYDDNSHPVEIPDGSGLRPLSY